MGSNRLPAREGWSIKPHVPEESGWYERRYGDGWIWKDYWDAQEQRWYTHPGGRKCVMQGKAWRRLKSAEGVSNE